MLYLDLPTGAHHGWGICGDNLSRAFASMRAIVRLERAERPPQPLPGPLLQSVGADLRPHGPELTALRRVGYAMFEDDEAVRHHAPQALASFDAVVTACRWGEDVLRSAGLTEVSTIPQGLDHTHFNPARAVRRRTSDEFLIFSGGKFELRKAQDVVARAFRAFSSRHDNVRLVAAWHNPFPASAATMIASPTLPFQRRPSESLQQSLARWLSNAGVELAKVELVPQLAHDALAAVYGNTDIGLFPNRCEGATNLVLMEYMACGRPVIGTYFSGHRDVLTPANSFPLQAWRTARSRSNGEVLAHWCEPNLDEIVEELEGAYQNRDLIAQRGAQAAVDLSEWTWERAARDFLRVLERSAVEV